MPCFDTGRYRRKKIRYRDEVTGKMITRDNPPIPGKQSLAKGVSIPLVSPVEFFDIIVAAGCSVS
ncbi:phage antitermination protein Q [Escherichia coli]|uniref:Phage antitermination protein Q n=1 Tax=Escherichia coli TaxID=562 RepID=A0A376L5M1_ECOLX|nr:phage antitermination protein Q [Escherichia coli]